MKEASDKVASNRELFYVYFHRAEPRLKGNFHISPEMQKISKEQAIFVDVTVPKKPTGDLLALLKQCKVTSVPRAVITDRYGNPLYPKATTTDPDRLIKQLKLAEAYAQKVKTALEEKFDKAKDYCRERQYSTAAMMLHKAMDDGLKGLPVLERMKNLYGQINTYLEGRLTKIRQAQVSEERKKEALKALRAKAYRELPVYDKIVAAYKTVS